MQKTANHLDHDHNQKYGFPHDDALPAFVHGVVRKMVTTEQSTHALGYQSSNAFQSATTTKHQPESSSRPKAALVFDADEHNHRAWIVDGCEFVNVTHSGACCHEMPLECSSSMALSATNGIQRCKPQSQHALLPEISSCITDADCPARCRSQRLLQAHHSVPSITGADQRSPLPASLGAAAAFLIQEGAIHRITVFRSLLISDMQDPESPPGFPLILAVPLFERATTLGLDQGWGSAKKYFRADPSVLRLAEEYFALLSYWDYQFTQPFLREHRADRGHELRMAVIHLLADIRRESSRRWAVAA